MRHERHIGREELDSPEGYVFRTAREHNVKIIQLWFTDILSFLKRFSITVEVLQDALKDGEVFDGSSIEGFIRHNVCATFMPKPHAGTTGAGYISICRSSSRGRYTQPDQTVPAEPD